MLILGKTRVTRTAESQELKSTVTEGVETGIRVILLEGRAINGTGFYFGFIYKGEELQFSGSGGDQRGLLISQS